MEVWGGNRNAESAAELPGIDAWVFSEPYDGSESGGDVHYVSSCASGRITRVLLADVSGHGPPVASIAEDLRHIMRRHINVVDQTQLVEAVNREFRPLLELGTHATAVAGTYFLPRRRLTICNAGHPPPLLYRGSLGRWVVLDRELDDQVDPPGEVIEGPANIPLGILEHASWSPISLRFEQDDLLLLYTDSAVEARDRTGEEIGTEGLRLLAEDVHDGDPASLVSSLVARLRAETEDRPFEDDLSLVLLRGNAVATRMRDDLAAPFRYLGDVLSRTTGLRAAG
jgi:serine phosphatase RsbU (regulator of sigma subunit)